MDAASQHLDDGSRSRIKTCATWTFWLSIIWGGLTWMIVGVFGIFWGFGAGGSRVEGIISYYIMLGLLALPVLPPLIVLWKLASSSREQPPHPRRMALGMLLGYVLISLLWLPMFLLGLSWRSIQQTVLVCFSPYFVLLVFWLPWLHDPVGPPRGDRSQPELLQSAGRLLAMKDRDGQTPPVVEALTVVLVFVGVWFAVPVLLILVTVVSQLDLGAFKTAAGSLRWWWESSPWFVAVMIAGFFAAWGKAWSRRSWRKRTEKEQETRWQDERLRVEDDEYWRKRKDQIEKAPAVLKPFYILVFYVLRPR